LLISAPQPFNFASETKPETHRGPKLGGDVGVPKYQFENIRFVKLENGLRAYIASFDEELNHSGWLVFRF